MAKPHDLCTFYEFVRSTHCPKTCGIQSVLRTVTDSHWRHFYFCSTSVFSALEVWYENALYKFTFDIDIDFKKYLCMWRGHKCQTPFILMLSIFTGCAKTLLIIPSAVPPGLQAFLCLFPKLLSMSVHCWTKPSSPLCSSKKCFEKYDIEV